jgi:hypothetical protein
MAHGSLSWIVLNYLSAGYPRIAASIRYHRPVLLPWGIVPWQLCLPAASCCLTTVLLVLLLLLLLLLLPGPRGLSWRDDKPAELCWMEAQVRLGQHRGGVRGGGKGALQRAPDGALDLHLMMSRLLGDQQIAMSDSHLQCISCHNSTTFVMCCFDTTRSIVAPSNTFVTCRAGWRRP